MSAQLKPAVGYIRMSTDKQEDSPEQQRAEITKLAKREGYRVLRWYEDHGISGAKTHKRPEFRSMIRDAESRGDFKAILCWDQDRFGRFDSIEAGEWVSPLRRVGVELVTVSQGHIDWDDFAGRLIYQITQEGKHRFLVDLSRNALRGMIRFAKQGSLLGHSTPYGYDRLYFNAAGEEVCRIRRGERFRKPRDWSGKLVSSVDAKEIETVRWLFETFTTTNRSARSLAVELNNRGIPSPSGGHWHFTHIKSMLKHPVYIGWMTFGRRSGGLYHHVGADGELRSNGRNASSFDGYAPIIVPDNHEPLIDKETFDAAQAKLLERSRVAGGPMRKYLLSGTLRCGHCGGIMTGSRGSRGRSKQNATYAYYKCKTSRDYGTCTNYAVRVDFIEPVLIEYFRSVWLTKAGRRSLVEALQAATEQAVERQPLRRESLLAQIAKLDQQISKGTENLLLMAPADIPAASGMLAHWREVRERVQVELNECQQVEPVPFDPDAVLAELDQLEEHLTGESVPLAKAAFLRVFERVTLFWEQVGPRRRELVRAEVTPRFPFCLTTNTSIRCARGQKPHRRIIRAISTGSGSVFRDSAYSSSDIESSCPVKTLGDLSGIRRQASRASAKAVAVSQ